jgi:hypothetical protein
MILAGDRLRRIEELQRGHVGAFSDVPYRDHAPRLPSSNP